MLRKVREHVGSPEVSTGQGKQSVEANFLHQAGAKSVPARRKPLKLQVFKHAKLIRLEQRYGDKTPPPLALENEEDAKIEGRDAKVQYSLRRSKRQANKASLANPFERPAYAKSPRSAELTEFLAEHFED